VLREEFSPMAQYVQHNRLRAGKARIMLGEIEVAFAAVERFPLVSRELKKLFYYLKCGKKDEEL